MRTNPLPLARVLAATICGLSSTVPVGLSFAQAPAAAASAQSAPLPRLPDGHPDLQGLWMKSDGGFQGLFIGSLDGTNFAAGGGGGGRGGASSRAEV